MDEAKQRERAQRAAPVVARRDKEDAPDTLPPSPAPVTPDAALQASTPVDKTVEKPVVPEPPKPPIAITLPQPPPPPVVQPPPATVPAPVPAVAPRPAGPVLVPPSKVKRISGDMPTLGKTKRAEVPPVVAAKVCIDAAGKVSGVDMITKLERLTSVDLSHAIHSWRHQPYKQNGTAVAACFVVSFRVQ
jgi:hypothetical protein